MEKHVQKKNLSCKPKHNLKSTFKGKKMNNNKCKQIKYQNKYSRLKSKQCIG